MNDVTTEAGPTIDASASSSTTASGSRWGIGPTAAIVAPACLASAAIHGAAISTHFDHATKYGVAFVVMTVALGLAGLWVLAGRSRRALPVAAVVCGLISVLWLLTRTFALPTLDKEEVGLADALATLLQGAAVAAVLVGRRELRSDSGRRGSPWVALTGGAIASLLAVPGIAAADEHAHGDHVSPEARSSISAIFAPLGHAHAVPAGGIVNATEKNCDPSSANIARADKLVADTILGLRRFENIDVAVKAGYRPLGFEPNGVHHYLNPAYRRDRSILDPNKPEAILYGRTRKGGLFPIGAMYMMNQPGQSGPRVGGCLTAWHSHGFPFAPIGQQSAEMMHVWTVPLPGGPYAEHAEGEYGRLFLGLEPIDLSDPKQTGLARRAGRQADGAASPRRPRAAAGAVNGTRGNAEDGSGIVTFLNALNVHREVFCTIGRPQLEANTTPVIVDRICDPIANGPLPGASAPSLVELLREQSTRRA